MTSRPTQRERASQKAGRGAAPAKGSHAENVPGDMVEEGRAPVPGDLFEEGHAPTLDRQQVSRQHWRGGRDHGGAQQNRQMHAVVALPMQIASSCAYLMKEVAVERTRAAQHRPVIHLTPNHS